jgi:hypothetical protein
MLVSECFEDDGGSEAYRQGHYLTWRLEILASGSKLLVNIKREGEVHPQPEQVKLLFPRQEARHLDIAGGSILTDQCGQMNRELLVSLA